ncbi:probable protein phosphatase 2C 22 isoform X2 [Mercurialis annua]|uniref:probable protein phosphatase 2C 22 isoform X2 n=1 Tax=Mercurialis annua TaxID=3986 RepID=UPI002160F764|nr:probable protein phosphatase 2C 22 isoform X2 [Mercurialis annua]
MEGSKGYCGIGENGSSSEGRPPNPLSASLASLQFLNNDNHSNVPVSCNKTLVKTRASGLSVEPELGAENQDNDFFPIVRSGAWADIGFRPSMEDVYICFDNFMSDYGINNIGDGPNAFYGVFDGHGGKHAADFACYHLPKFIVEDEDFPREIQRVVASAFLQTDNAFAEACSVNAALSSGSTALAALIMGRLLVVANAGDCRAVLCRRGKAIEMSRDHKPVCSKEKKRIEASGGHVFDGYLNGLLNVARAIGDWHMEGMKSKDGGPLSAEPELMTTQLTEEDEFLIIGCDGIWDVFRSQNAVDFARRRLQEHNDPAMCSKDVVDEALKRKSGDNLSVVVVCFKSEPPPNLVAARPRVHRSFSAEGLRELQSFLDNLAN